MTTQIVRLSPEDLSRLDALVAAADAEGLAQPPRTPCNRLATVTLFAAMLDGDVVGVGAVLLHPGAPARIVNVYVLPERRRCGVGRVLAGALTHEALENAASVTLAADDARAAAFWTAMGYARGEADRFTLSRAFEPTP